MSDKQPLKATFFAFRKREKSGVLLRASLAFLIGSALLFAVFVALFWSSVGPVLNWYGEVLVAAANQGGAPATPPEMPSQFFGFIGGLLLWLFPFYILYAAFEAACLRWMIHGENVGVMGLSLGAPTWRVWGVYWMWFLLNIAFSIAVGIAAAALIGMMMISTGNAAGVQTAQPVIELIQYVLMIYFAVRLAPAAATTIARRRFAFFDAWKVTRGRFWSLLGSFVSLWVLYFIVTIVLTVVGFGAILGNMAVDWTALSDPAQSTAAGVELMQSMLERMMQPEAWAIMIGLWIVGSVLGLLFYIACYGVNARAAQAALEEGKITADA